MRRRLAPVHILTVALVAILSLAACKPEPDTANPLSLLGRAWQVTSIGGQDVTVADPAHAPSIVFTANGRVSGFTGCNRMNGEARIGKGTIDISENLATTRMACLDPGRNDTERRFTETLPRAKNWTMEGDTLVFKDESARPIMAFRAAAANAAE